MRIWPGWNFRKGQECLGELARDPFSRRVCCDVDPDQVSAAQTDDDEGIEQVEANGRNDEQVHGSDVRRVVAQKGAPPLTWRSTPLDHVLGDARRRDIEPELEQFAVDTRRTPKRILHAHLPDQRAEVRLDLRSPSRSARFPTPVAAKAGTMPPNERLRLDDREDLQNRRKPSIQLNKEPAVVVRQPDPALHLTPQNDQLMSENRILCLKSALRLEWQAQNGQDEAEQSEHGPQTLGDSFG